MANFRESICDLIVDKTGLNPNIIKNMVSRPSGGRGDFSFPCFGLAKEKGENPSSVAESFKSLADDVDFLEKIETVSGFVNFFIKRDIYVKNVLESFELVKNFKKGSIILEYPSPNTNKPLHLGHIRNIVIGNCLFNLLSFAGFSVKRVNLNNDRGISMCSAMLGYDLFKDELDFSGDKGKVVGDAYVLFVKKSKEDSSLVEKSKELLQKWEQRDKNVIKLWEEVNNLSLNSHKNIYSFFGLSHNKVYSESEIYQEGKNIVLNAVKKNLFEEDDEGFVFVNLEDKKLDKKILLRDDGTSVYVTQDIALASNVSKDLNPDVYVYITASEQNFYFKQLFEIFKILNIDLNPKHVSYGLVNLPEGRMKSREGNVVDALDIINDISASALEELKNRNNELDEKELGIRSKKICLGAINFAFANHDLNKNITFKPEESIKFDGETGAYIQYTYARLVSSLKNCESVKNCDFSLISDDFSLNIIRLIEDLNVGLVNCVENFKISSFSQIIFSLCQALNAFYENNKINVNDEKLKESRVLLVNKCLKVLKECMNLVGVPVMEKM